MTVEHDFEEPRLDVNGFVVSYFTWRIEMNGLEWYEKPELPFGVQLEHEALRKIALIFENRHPELHEMVKELMAERSLSFARYCEVVDHFGKTEQELEEGMSFGRLVGLISFGGLIATKFAEENLRREISQMAVFTAKFIDKRIRLTWVSDERSWAKFMQMADSVVKREEISKEKEAQRKRTRRWSIIGIAAASIVGVGAIIGTKALMSK